jgi:CheY-like chemotaxis protein
MRAVRAQALTASCSAEERTRCAEAGCVQLLPKPIRLDALCALLQRHLGGTHAEQAAAVCE